MSRHNVIKWAAYAVAILLISVFQLQAAFFPRIEDVTPLFIIPAVVAVAMQEGETAGGIYGLAAGLFWDCGTGRVFGFNAFMMMVTGIAAGLFIKFLIRKTLLSSLIITALFTAVQEMLTWFFFYFMTGSRHISYIALHVIVPTLIMTLIFAVPLYYGARAINRGLTEQESELPS